jgi:hypothetical protein
MSLEAAGRRAGGARWQSRSGALGVAAWRYDVADPFVCCAHDRTPPRRPGCAHTRISPGATARRRRHGLIDQLAGPIYYRILITGAPVDGDYARRPRTRLLTALAAIVLIVAGYAIWTISSPYTLQAAAEIKATPQQAWAILTDLSAYKGWNPFIISSSGTIKVGATLTNVMHDASGHTTFTPTAEVVVTGPGTAVERATCRPTRSRSSVP